MRTTTRTEALAKPHRQLPLAALALGVALLLTMGCRSPRDPDLDRRVHQAKLAKDKRGSAAPVTAEAPPKSATGASPPRGKKQISYSDEEKRRILGRVGGSGPRLVATITTNLGTFECELDEANAPQTVTNFVALATGQKPWTDPDTKKQERGPFYNGLAFHRIISNFIAQTGNPAAGHARAGGPGWTIPKEDGTPNAYDKGGVMGAVDDGEDTHGSQWFVTLRSAKNLAGRFTPFGSCSGLDVVRQISNVETLPPGANEKSPTRPKDPATITSVSVTRKP